MERTLVLVKPDGVQRGLIGEIIGRYEKRGFKIPHGKIIKAKKDIVEKHYEEHKGRSYFNELINYMMEGPIMAIIVEGEKTIDIVRKMNGHKDFLQADPGTIRGDFANSITRNIVHASDSIESAKREIDIWFPDID